MVTEVVKQKQARGGKQKQKIRPGAAKLESKMTKAEGARGLRQYWIFNNVAGLIEDGKLSHT